MHNFIASLTPIITRFVLIASTSFILSYAQADELKDISQLANQGQTALALDRVNTYLATNPKNTQALFMKGVFLAEQGRRDEAIRIFTDITEKSPNLPEPYNNLAVLYADQGQFDKARKALETAIKTHPSYATAHENLGDIYARMASDAYDKALQLDTSNARAQGKLSLIKDLFGTGSKITMASKEPVKANNTEPVKTSNAPLPATKKLEVTPAEDNSKKTLAIKKPDVIVTKTTAQTSPTDANTLLTATVNRWSQAWASKNLDLYFASYGSSFKPEHGLSRQTWEKQRQQRITNPSSINIKLENLDIESNDTTAKVKFKQYYSADGRSISTNKTLHMKKAGNDWYIIREIAGN